jgi:hypothetical protein
LYFLRLLLLLKNLRNKLPHLQFLEIIERTFLFRSNRGTVGQGRPNQGYEGSPSPDILANRYRTPVVSRRQVEQNR